MMSSDETRLIIALADGAALRDSPPLPEEVRVERAGSLAVLVFVENCAEEGHTDPVAVRFLQAQWQLWRHLQVVPFRFGQSLGRLESAAEIMLHEDHWQALLEKIGACAEISLYWTSPSRDDTALPGGEEAQPPPSSGGDYLRRRQAVYQQRDRVPRGLSQLQQVVREAVPTLRQERLLAGDQQYEWTVLVPREDLKKVQEILEDYSDIEVQGPFPPWTFASSPRADKWRG